MCTGSMTRPVAAMTTVRYDATYQWDGLTPSKAGSGVVPNDPPMISIVTTGKAKTNVRVNGSRAIRSDLGAEQSGDGRPRRPYGSAGLDGLAGRSSSWSSGSSNQDVRALGRRPVEQVEQGRFEVGHVDREVVRDLTTTDQVSADLGDDLPIPVDGERPPA